MNLRYYMVLVLATILKYFPLPQKTGIITLGQPDKSSPVLLTVNYRLTVEILKRVLSGIDAYLLIANSRGINVWCAATGGHFTTHDVISVLKTSRIADLVEHRTLILPQLAATGIERRVIRKKTGWKSIWGPVQAKDIPEFLQVNMQKSQKMRQIKFPLTNRIEMAVGWAFPISLIAGVILFFLWPIGLWPVVIMIWAISMFFFLFFPLINHLLQNNNPIMTTHLFVFKYVGFQFILLAIVSFVLITYNQMTHTYSSQEILILIIITELVIFIFSIDLLGNTPTYKSALHDEKFAVIVDEDKCRAAADCENVCPMSCFEIDHDNRIATRPRASSCVQCGACIVQCPFDALYFENPKGDILKPETIRKYKLNMMGKRAIELEPK